jgi:hypothetical protein
MEKFNVAAAVAGLNPVSVTEYRMVTDRVAKVIVTSAVSALEDLRQVSAAILDKFQGNAAPIADSFTWLQPGRSMIGYVASTRVTRDIDDSSLKANYRVLSSNLYMDASDESLWEMKEGAGGRYLARQGHDDLSSLIEAARVSPRGSTPRMASVISASASPKEFVSFVYDSGYGIPAVEYGFCVARKNGQLDVLSSSNNQKVTISDDAIVSSHQIALAEAHAKITATKNFTAATTSAMGIEEYYRTAYQYAPDYVEKLIKQIQEMRAM